MKKTLITLSSLLVAVFIVLSIASSGGIYDAEKLLYSALRAGEKIMANPDVVPPSAARSIENKLQYIVKNYPGTPIAEIARMKIAEFYALTKNYDKAIEALDEVIYSSEKKLPELSQALFLKGNIYEKKNQWFKALAVYGTLRDRCKDTPLGLQIPLYVADYYTKNSMAAEAISAYNDAATFYDRVSKERRGTIVGYWASTYLVISYLNLKRFEDAGRVVEEIINSYPGTASYTQHLPSVEYIFVKQLKEPQKALGIYKSVQQKTNNAQLQAVLKKKISELEKVTSK